MLDARVVSVNMYQRNALTLRELQSIQSLRDRPVEAAEMLMKIIVEQPDAVYLCFLDVLKHTGQQHIYQILVEGGYRGLDLYIHTYVRTYVRMYVRTYVQYVLTYVRTYVRIVALYQVSYLYLFTFKHKPLMDSLNVQ